MAKKSNFRLDIHGISTTKHEYWNLSPSLLVEEAICRNEGKLSENGALIVNTLPCSGRSPNDKFIVKDPTLEEDPIFWGKTNKSIGPKQFDGLYLKVIEYLKDKDIFVRDMFTGASPSYQLPIRVITENAWQNLFANNLFLRPSDSRKNDQAPVFTVIAVPGLTADPTVDSTNSGVFIALHFGRKIILIGGTRYAGEIKKSIFTVMNYLLPRQGILSMHCSANLGKDGDVALFFGLSGTGKTTLSSDPDRRLIGDDEHGWSDEGVFNFEGGCYAKLIKLHPELEPLIWAATHRFGAVLENVVMDPESQRVDFDDSSLTENTRGAYPIDYIPNNVPEGYAGHPKNIFFLTADASGVLPPLSRLTPAQAQYHFLLGYTSKLAGTEKELGSEPQATFSTCFAVPFLPLNPSVYATLLGKKIEQFGVKVWLVNTGWTGGPYGVGKRMYLPHTRAMIRAALSGQLDDIPTIIDPVFGLAIPQACPDVPCEVLYPRSAWTSPAAYDLQANKLAVRFYENFSQYERFVSEEVYTSGPKRLENSQS